MKNVTEEEATLFMIGKTISSWDGFTMTFTDGSSVNITPDSMFGTEYEISEEI